MPGSSRNTELSEYQQYTSYALSADTDNSLFLANQIDIHVKININRENWNK